MPIVSTDTASNPRIPTVALTLGLAGLIPFVGAALLSLTGTRFADIATTALVAYGAVILSFLGGVRWGAVLHDPPALAKFGPLTWSILPSLLAWVALLLPPSPSITLLLAGLVGQYLLDRKGTHTNQLPAWYLRLRTLLTTGAGLSLLIALVGGV